MSKKFGGSRSCEHKRVVKVFKRRDGKDQLIGKDTSSSSGRWVVPDKPTKGTYYAKLIRATRREEAGLPGRPVVQRHRRLTPSAERGFRPPRRLASAHAERTRVRGPLQLGARGRARRHGRLLRVRRAAQPPRAARQAGDRRTGRSAVPRRRHDRLLRGAEVRGPLGAADRRRAAPLPPGDRHPAQHGQLPRGIGQGDGGLPPLQRPRRGRRHGRGLRRPDRIPGAEGARPADQGRGARPDRA